MGALTRKTAVITGGATGIGRAAAERLAADGAFVFVTGRRAAELDTTVASIGQEGAAALPGDIAGRRRKPPSAPSRGPGPRNSSP